MSNEIGKREVILVVEDEGSIRRLAARTLQRAGYEVLEARNGAEAMEIAREQAGAIDLVLTDMVMPQTSGPELVKQLREQWGDLRVLYISGYTELTRRQDIAFLHKPFTGQELLSQVREMLESGAA